MTTHQFIFSPGRWLGKSEITVHGASKPLKCYLRWDISQAKGEAFSAVQTVEIEDVREHVITSYFFTDITETTFAVFLDSASIGQVVGKGTISPDGIGWEFHSPLLEGFERYETMDNGNYKLYAEYTSTGEYRTIIEAILWKKME